MDQREVACTFFGQKSADTDALQYTWAHTMARVATATAQNGQKSKCFTIQCWLAILTGLQVWKGCVCNFLGKIADTWAKAIPKCDRLPIEIGPKLTKIQK